MQECQSVQEVVRLDSFKDDLRTVLNRTSVTVEVRGSYRDIFDRARTTIRKQAGSSEPSPQAKFRILRAEHSPIREMDFLIKIRNLPSWVSVHLVRHHEGFTPYVTSQRDDRNNEPIPRGQKPQNELVDMDIRVNTQGLINVMRKRLCGQASAETRLVANKIKDAVVALDKSFAQVLVPECVYRCHCPEWTPCAYNDTKAQYYAIDNYKTALEEARENATTNS